jgi:two-component system, cell cycle sensor histidine kinase and response regulator CckA
MPSTATRVRPAVRRRETRATILVIEDERFVRDVTCEILGHAGYRVLQAECAASARRVFRRYGKRIQLLLCDVVLPDSSGVHLAQTLRRSSAHLKVILASGYPRGTLRGGRDETGYEFLAKPYGAASLVLSVQMALRNESGTAESASQIRAR